MRRVDAGHRCRRELQGNRYILNFPMAATAFQNSLYLSIGSATFIMLLTSVIAWITVKSRLPGRAVLDTMTFVPIAIPGIVGTAIAIGSNQ